MARHFAVLAIAILVLVPVASAWGQFQGGPMRTGIADVPSGDLDATGFLALREEGSPARASILPQTVLTIHGIASFGHAGDGTCALWFAGDATPITFTGCENGALQAYDGTRDIAIICEAGVAGQAAVHVYESRSGQKRWSFELGSTDRELDSSSIWTCDGVAHDPAAGVLVVPYVGSSDGVEAIRWGLLRIDLGTGDEQGSWEYPQVGYQARTDGSDGALHLAVPIELWPGAATLIDDTMVLMGKKHLLGGGLNARPAAFWGAPGDPVAFTEDDGLTEPWQRSAAAVGFNSLAAFRLGESLLLVDPLANEPLRDVPLPAFETEGPAFHFGTSPIVHDADALYVPTRHNIVAVDATDLDPRWQWPGLGQDWPIWNVMVDPNGDVLVMAYHDRGDRSRDGESWSDESLLIRLDASTGLPIQVIPIPLHPAARHGFYSWCDGASDGPGCHTSRMPLDVVPASNGLVVSDRMGHAYLVTKSTGTAAIDVAADEHYPARGEIVTVTIEPHDLDEVASLRVSWGDGSIDAVKPTAETGLFREEVRSGVITLQHNYRDSGVHHLIVTVARIDGFTESTRLRFDVEGTPPLELNFMQEQFTAENQDRTWGVIGLAVALIGAVWALFFRKRRHRKIRKNLHALNAIHSRSLEDPEGALMDLDAHRRYLRGQLMNGRIDDGQFRLIAARMQGISRRIHRALLGPMAGQLSNDFLGMLESAFEDGLLSHAEAMQLLDRVDREPALAKGDADRLRALIGRWGDSFGAAPA